MAIVKASYTRAASRASLQSSVRYAARRPGDEGREREGYSGNRDNLSRAEATETLGQAKGEYLYRVVLNAGDARETETDLKALTRDTMGSLAEGHGEVAWVAYEHRDHSAQAHVHVIAVLEKKLDKGDLERLREAATDSHSRQQSWTREAYRDDYRDAQTKIQENAVVRDGGREW